MNKTEFIKVMSDEANISLRNARVCVESFIQVATKILASGEDLNLIGFGSFKVVERSARPGRDFNTGKMIQVPASKTVKFKVGKTLKNAVCGE